MSKQGKKSMFAKYLVVVHSLTILNMAAVKVVEITHISKIITTFKTFRELQFR